MTDTITELEQLTLTDVVPYESNDDPNHRTHIVRPPENKHIYQPGMSAQDIVDTARILGVEVVCLCGFRFIPKSNPEKHDICESCMKIAGDLMRAEGE